MTRTISSIRNKYEVPNIKENKFYFRYLKKSRTLVVREGKNLEKRKSFSFKSHSSANLITRYYKKKTELCKLWGR